MNASKPNSNDDHTLRNRSSSMAEAGYAVSECRRTFQYSRDIGLRRHTQSVTNNVEVAKADKLDDYVAAFWTGVHKTASLNILRHPHVR